MANQDDKSISSLLLQSIPVAIEAGNAIMKVRLSGSFRMLTKEDNSPLTEADEASNRLICMALESYGVPILSEEGKLKSYEQRKTWKEFWLVDPLDGTREFIKGNGDFTVNIALIYNTLPILGVVYAPALDIMYFAAENIGSYRLKLAGTHDLGIFDLEEIISRSEKLPCRKNRGRKNTLVVSRSHLNDDTKNYIQKIKRESGNINILYRGSAIKFCLVAENSADIYPRFGPTSEWDTAAGHAVAINAGCTVTQYPSGSNLLYNKPDLINPWFIVSR